MSLLRFDEVSLEFGDQKILTEADFAIEPGERLEMTFHPRWDPVLDQAGSVREVWSLEEVEGVTRVTVACYDLDAAGPAYAHFAEGVPLIVSGMKTLLETGEPLAR